MGLLVGGVLLAVVAIVMTQLRHRNAANDLGRLSEKWVEHERTSPSP